MRLISVVQFEKSLPEDTNLRLVESVQKNTKRYIDVFSQAVDAVMPRETKEMTYAAAWKQQSLRLTPAGSKMMFLMLSCRSVKSVMKPWPWLWRRTWMQPQVHRFSHLN